VGRIDFSSEGKRVRLSENQTGMPMRSGTISRTMRWAMWAEGRNTTVESCGPTGNTKGAMSTFARIAAWLVKPIFGSPVAPDVKYKMAASLDDSSSFMRDSADGSRS